MVSLLSYLWIASVLLGSLCHGDDSCVEMDFRCQRVLRDSTLTQIISLEWPLTSAHSDLADNFCRVRKESGKCVEELLTRCSSQAFVRDNRRYKWYEAKSDILLSTLCASAVNPVEFIRAFAECFVKGREFFWNVVPSIHDDYAEARNATTALRMACKTSRLFAEVNGSVKTSWVASCGQKPVDVLIKGHKLMHDAACL
ncbi:uncharacterized protein LOC129592557 [Paramacrobiotus metropolitanus]|uniref:uncharacterized protein LOC129592557 n=1 Tax=Paramacrobiotus metropolitanus TaxID=2943436 RepID=UPI0024457BA6|nr:uncharacterized protein LOC129592557 [Paramacrobiotus metropolitanus]